MPRAGADPRAMPARRLLLALALGLGLTTSLAACAADEPQEPATAGVTSASTVTSVTTAPATTPAACTTPPRISARRRGAVIAVHWSAHVPRSCGRAFLLITGHSTSLDDPALVTTERDIDASAGEGDATIRLVVDHPPHVVRASLNMGRVVEVPVAGDKAAGPAMAREQRRRAACERMIARRTTCRIAVEADRLAGADPRTLERALRRSIEASGGWTTEALRCRPDGRCRGSFSLLHGPDRVGMAYTVGANRVTGCWTVTSYTVTRPLTRLPNFAPPAAFSLGCATP